MPQTKKNCRKNPEVVSRVFLVTLLNGLINDVDLGELHVVLLIKNDTFKKHNINFISKSIWGLGF